MTVESSGCVLNVSARVHFRSDEEQKPARLNISYLYVDDPFLPYSPRDLLLDKCPL